MNQREIRVQHRQWLDDKKITSEIPRGEPFDPWRLKVLPLVEFRNLSAQADRLSPSQLAYFFAFGLLGPTSHNTNPERVKFETDENGFRILLDRKYILAGSDKQGRQASVSTGCVMANIEAAARAYGWQMHAEILTPPVHTVEPFRTGEGRYTDVATVQFQQGKIDSSDVAWLQSILDRKIVRAEYDEAVGLPPELVTLLQNRMKKRYPSLKLHLVTDRSRLRALGKLQEMADYEVFNQDDFSLELGEWLLPNDDTTVTVGMRGAEFGLSDTMSQRIHDGLLRKERLTPDEVTGFAHAGNLGIAKSSAVGVITVKEDNLEQRIAAGRAYEDMALLLHLHNFCTAVHAGTTEVESGPTSVKDLLVKFDRRPTVVFRIGVPKDAKDRQRPHSSRPMLNEVVLV